MTVEHQLDMADLQQINQSYVDYLSSLEVQQIRQRVESVTVRDLHEPGGITKAKEMLDEFGVLVIPDAVSATTCIRAATAIGELHGAYCAHSDTYEDDRALFQPTAGPLRTYHQLSSYGKTVITVRRGQDDGMIDIFNCDLALSDAMREIRHLFEDGDVMALIQGGRRALRPRNLNAYINRSMIETRGFHVDSYAENLKAFIYLTDVLTLSDGPYTYVKASHRGGAFRRVNRYLLRDSVPVTETPLIPPLAITPILGCRGSLVISDQSGSHRGWPQALDHQRVVAVMKYA